jgi:hypothetical protein
MEIGAVGLRRAAEGRLGQLLVSSPFIGAVLAILTWPIVSIVPGTGPDPSWVAGLYMAHGEGLRFGPDLVFTYGPLGFLEVPALYVQAMWILAFLYQAFLHVALAISLLWVARRALPLAVAAALCFVLQVIGLLEGAAVLLAFVWCFIALDERAPRFAVPLVAIGGGALGAIELLGKVNYGIAILCLAAMVVLVAPGRRRNCALFAATALGVFASAWFAGGQDLSTLPDFASRTAWVVSGYSGAMGTDIGAHAWERIAALAAMALLVTGAAAAGWRAPWPRRIASVALATLFSFMAFKQGFVRQGLGNTPEFFALVAAAGLAVASRLPRQSLWIGALRRAAPLAGVAVVAPLTVLALIVLPTPSLWHSLQPRPHVEYMRQGFEALLSGGERERLTGEARRSMRATYRLDPRILRALGSRPVHVDPWEVGVAWAYGLAWQPLPTMQSYLAYTPALDRLNATALSGGEGPAAILRQSPPATGAGGSVDSRYPGWESPAAMRAMLCHYRPAVTGPRWQLLERTANRCGAVRPLGVVRSQTGRQIAVPPPPAAGELVFAKVAGLGVGGWEALRTALYRARERTVTLGAKGAWRLPPATPEDGLLVSAPRAIDYPGRFRLAPDVRALSFGIAGASPRPLTVEFFAQRVDREPWPRR